MSEVSNLKYLDQLILNNTDYYYTFVDGIKISLQEAIQNQKKIVAVKIIKEKFNLKIIEATSIVNHKWDHWQTLVPTIFYSTDYKKGVQDVIEELKLIEGGTGHQAVTNFINSWQNKISC